jgi:hypothetical protein
VTGLARKKAGVLLDGRGRETGGGGEPVDELRVGELRVESLGRLMVGTGQGGKGGGEVAGGDSVTA